MVIKVLLPALLLTIFVSGCVQSEITGSIINKDEIKRNLSMLAVSGAEKRVVETLSEPVFIDAAHPETNTSNSSNTTAPQCSESWSCSSWGSCNNGIKTRTCTDQNSCGTTASKPAESQSCEIQQFSVKIKNISYKSPEWVEIINNGSASVDTTNWTLKDSTTLSSHVYTFPQFILAKDSVVKVYTGNGTDTQTDLYWNKGRGSLWNDDGDTATLKDSAGNVIDVYSYS